MQEFFYANVEISIHKKYYHTIVIKNNILVYSNLLSLIFQGLLHGPSVSQLGHHDSLPSHQSMQQQQQQQQQHRQELSHHQQQHLNVNEPRSMMHHGQNLFHQQQAHGSPRQMTPRPQNPQQRNMSNRQRMVRD